MTKYLLRWGHYYLEKNGAVRHWVHSSSEATRFEFYSIAVATAIMEVGLSTNEFTIEIVNEE